MSCGSPMPRGEQIAKPAEQATRSAGFFFATQPGGDMGDRLHFRLSRETVSRLFPVFAVGLLVAACQNAEQSLAPKVGGPRFSASASEGLKGRIAFHSNRDGDFDIYVMNADGSGVTNVTNNDINEF